MVEIPLMPSGVEHDLTDATESESEKGGNSFDAVRR